MDKMWKHRKSWRRAFVLLSGGLDSTTALAIAERDANTIWNGGIECVSIDYGQRHQKEIKHAAHIAWLYDCQHSVLTLPDLLAGGSMLTDAGKEIPNVSYDEIEGVSPTYVPFRNGLMISMIAAHAQRWVNSAQKNQPRHEAGVFIGAHAEDAANWAYPDCTPEFIGAMANALYIGTYGAVRLHAPLMNMTKQEIVKRADALIVPLADTWSCYKGGEKHCGVCPTCRSRRQAFELAGVVDPTEYEEPSPFEGKP